MSESIKTVEAGAKFGRLRVVERVSTAGGGWVCECECGKRVRVTGSKLRTGHTRSCECLRREVTVANNKARATHGARRGGQKPPEYVAWSDMIARCETLNNTNYCKYGARGIGVCRRWRGSYAAFLADVGHRPGGDYSLGRLDNDGDYEPGNVRWQTDAEQQRNRRNTRYVSYRGETKPLVVWAEELGLRYHTVLQRFLAGWSPERAFETPTLSA